MCVCVCAHVHMCCSHVSFLLTFDDGAVLCSREDNLAVTSDSDACQWKLVTTAVANVIHSWLHILHKKQAQRQGWRSEGCVHHALHGTHVHMHMCVCAAWGRRGAAENTTTHNS